jgi:MFS family permease
MEDFKPLIRNTKFAHLWLSQVLSQLTINIMNFLLLIRLFENTGSTIATSFLWVAYALPAILIGPFAAAAVDMIDRRKTLMFTNLLQSLVIFLYVFLHKEKLFLLYGVALSYSFLNQFYVPAEAASVPTLVKKNILPLANSLFFLTQQVALIIGFGSAGVLNQFLGFENSLFLCSGFLFLAFLSVSLLPKMKTRDSVPKKFEAAIVKFFTRILEGYKFIKENRSILLPFLILLGLQVALAVVTVNVPVLATEILKIKPNSAGLMMVVPAGLGAGVGALLISRFLKRGWRKKRIIEVNLKIMTLLFFIFTFIIPEMSPTIRMFLALLTVFLGGFSFVGILIPSQTFLQEKTPGGLRGRVFGNFWFLVTIATIFPVIFSGAISELFGIKLLLFFLTGALLITLWISQKHGEGLINNQ